MWVKAVIAFVQNKNFAWLIFQISQLNNFFREINQNEINQSVHQSLSKAR